ncbi:MAG: alanine racemase [Bdellovibrionota bacterium]
MSSKISYSQWNAILANERLPAVVVDLDAFDRNVAKMASLVHSYGKTLRLATKSVRVPELIQRVLNYGPVFQGLMCYSIEEAAFWAERGLDDLFIAYPSVRKSDLKILRDLHEQGKKISIAVDSVQGLEALSGEMQTVKQPFSVVVDIDVSLRLLGGLVHLGVRRSPIHSRRELEEFLDHAQKYPQLRVRGAMAYDAQIAGLGDKNPFKKLINPAAKLIRKLSQILVAPQRQAVVQAFKARSLALEFFNGGGTGSLNLAARENSLTELSAGSGLLCSHLFDYYSNIQFEPACFFALQVVRKPSANHVTCQGGGYIASGEPGWDRVPVPYLPEELKLVRMEGAGEVQTPLSGNVNDLMLGSPVLFRHAKAGELAERFNEYLLVSQGKIVSRAKTYRGLGLCFF